MSPCALEEPAEPRGVRPRPIAPAPEGFFGRPDLLERRPVVGGALRPVEPVAVALLEAPVHLEPAVVRLAGVRPAALEAVDAEELPQVRRVLRLHVRPVRALPPEPGRTLGGLRRERGQGADVLGRQRHAHHTLPVPRLRPETGYLASVVGECRSPARLLCCCRAAGAERRTACRGQRDERHRGRETTPQKKPPPYESPAQAEAGQALSPRGRHRAARLCGCGATLVAYLLRACEDGRGRLPERARERTWGDEARVEKRGPGRDAERRAGCTEAGQAAAGGGGGNSENDQDVAGRAGSQRPQCDRDDGERPERGREDREQRRRKERDLGR